jgi:hypothetical protein
VEGSYGVVIKCRHKETGQLINFGNLDIIWKASCYTIWIVVIKPFIDWVTPIILRMKHGNGFARLIFS